jgi:hypothetical protein
MTLRLLILLTAIAATSLGAALADNTVGNLGYNSYESNVSKGAPLEKYFGPGVGYPTDAGGDYFRRYYPPEDWGKYGYGTGHLGEGYGPLIYPRRAGSSPPGMFDPLPAPYQNAPPPKIKVGGGRIRVLLPKNIPGITCVTVTMVAFNNAELATQSIQQPPFAFDFPVLDGVKNVRVRIDYANRGLSATTYSLGS